MFYFLLAPIMTYNLILIAAAVIPAVILMIRVYRSDKLEKESPQLLRQLVIAGILASLLAMVEERLLSWLLSAMIGTGTVLYNVILYFGIVAFAEESSKYLLLKRRSWNSSEFDCRFDGVVYAVFVSLGFALWENISYVMLYGFSTALVRAVTAIPGHACFGVFMGIFYALAKESELAGDGARSKLYRFLSVLVPALLHGAYDYIASLEIVNSGWYFVIFIAVLFAVSFVLVSRASKDDHYMPRS